MIIHFRLPRSKKDKDWAKNDKVMRDTEIWGTKVMSDSHDNPWFHPTKGLIKWSTREKE